MSELTKELFTVDRGEGDHEVAFYEAVQVDDLLATLRARLEEQTTRAEWPAHQANELNQRRMQVEALRQQVADLTAKLEAMQATIARQITMLAQNDHDGCYGLIETIGQLQATVTEMKCAEVLCGHDHSTQHWERLYNEAQSTLTAQREEIGRLLECLTYYADPGTYHGCGFMFDRPTGGFDDDFDDGHAGYDRPMPGKAARHAISTTQEPT